MGSSIGNSTAYTDIDDGVAGGKDLFIDPLSMLLSVEWIVKINLMCIKVNVRYGNFLWSRILILIQC